MTRIFSLAQKLSMKNKIAFLGATAVSVLLPIIAFAQGAPLTCASTGGGGGANTLGDIICRIDGLLQLAIPVLILGAVAWFIFGIVKFMTAHDAEEKGAARGTMIHGIIGFAVIIGLWGLVKILLGTFSIGKGAVNTSDFPIF